MRKKIISTAVVITTITLFALASQPKTAVGTAAMTTRSFSINDGYTVVNTYTDFVMPTMRPFPTLHIERRFGNPIVSSEPQSTATPIAATKTSSPAPTTTARPTQTATPQPTVSQTSQPTTQPTQTSNSYTDQVIGLVNQERAKSNLAPLTKNDQLANSAQNYAQYMADKNFFSHDGPDGSTFISRNKAAGYYPYRYLGENIAAGQRSPQEVMSAWMNSSGHRANIMKAEYKEIGVGYTSKSGTTYRTYWAQEFGAK